MNGKLFSFLSESGIKYETNVSLKTKTWISRGGIAYYYIIPSNKQELLTVIRYLYLNNLKFTILGHTSNTYIYNSCNIDIVVTTKMVNEYELLNNTLYCSAGVSVIKLANDMVRRGIKGFEFLTDLPGTVGAAICNNSSCKDNSISKLLSSIDVILSDGRVISMKASELGFGYRTSIFKTQTINGVILGAYLKINLANKKENLKDLAIENKKYRDENLEGPKFNLGCTVNKIFENGKMPIIYRLLLKFYSLFLKIAEKDENKRRVKSKNFVCQITGYKQLSPYVSSKNVSIFLWKDENADRVFDTYLEFMERIYKTKSVEISILK